MPVGGADDAHRLVEQVGDALEDLVLAEAGDVGDIGERPPGDREVPLQQVEELLVGVVERDGGPVLAASDLGYSHPQTSFAW